MKKNNHPSLFAAAPLPVAPLNDPERLACLRLIRSENVGPVTFRALINHFGGARAALDALPDLARRGGQKRAIRICPQDVAEAELAAVAKTGAVLIFTIEPGYPALLAHAEVPPPFLYIRGRLDLLNRPTVAIVGSRLASAAGQKMARQFANDLGHAGFVIVSGLARGIDGAAHVASLATGTVGVVAGGIDVVYPPEHLELQRRIASEGCLVTEQPPGIQPKGRDFPRRNRIIAGLSLGVLVVEAARRSGSLGTARLATEHGREVFAVPGHPLDPRAEGTNALLKSGATLATEAQDIVAALAPQMRFWGGQAPMVRDDKLPTQSSPDLEAGRPPVDRALLTPTPSTAGPDRTDDELSTLLRALGPAPVDIDDLTRATHLSPGAVQAHLLELDLAGRIQRHGAHLVSLRSGSPLDESPIA